MKRLLLFVLGSAALLRGLTASACETHLNGHQNGSDTSEEASQR
jgi:hypothetical protein